MRIILDAMGGDNAPDAIILGAVRAANEFAAELVLVGRGAEILEALKRLNIATLPKGMEVANAEDVVDMHDDPSTVIRRRRDSSMVVGLQMLAAKSGDAFISAGSTGALLSASSLIVKRIPGIRRAALAPVIPTAEGRCVLIDSGATVECKPEFLAQFACMGSLFAKSSLGIANPRVGLLNIGDEDNKGTPVQRAAYGLLQELDRTGLIHFTGNIEARAVPLGGADVVVSDGFSGNVLLKSIEGTAQFMSQQLKKIFTKNLLTKLGAVFCKSGLEELKAMSDYRTGGGTPLLGISKPGINAHGSSDDRAVFHAVRQAIDAVQHDLSGTIRDQINQMSITKEQSNVE